MWELLKAYRRSDPAARSYLEVLLLYPGIKAICFHRVAQFLWRIRLRWIGRLVAECGRFITGIEVHPAAKIGRRVVFDHGMGIVIGETAILGDDVILYQGVTLGGTSLDTLRRHPMIGNHVVIGAGAKVLGNIFVGDGSRIGANSVVIKDVPAHTTVAGVPARVIHEGIKPGEELCHDYII